MSARDVIIARRATITDAARRRMVPTATIARPVRTAPLARFLETINAPGRLPPGLRAELAHLVVRAAARALADHSHFGHLLLPGGAVYESDQAIVRLTLDGPGSFGEIVVHDPAGRPLAEVVAELDAFRVEGRIRQQDEIRKALRRRRTRPLLDLVLYDGLIESLLWLRDHVRLPQSWVHTAVYQTGNLSVHDLGQAAARAACGTLTGARSAQLIITGPERVPVAGDGRAEEVIRLGLGYDMRLFEPWEAAAYLQAVATLLAEPETRLA